MNELADLLGDIIGELFSQLHWAIALPLAVIIVSAILYLS